MFAAFNQKSLVYGYDVLPLITLVVKSDLFVHLYRTGQMLCSGAGKIS